MSEKSNVSCDDRRDFTRFEEENRVHIEYENGGNEKDVPSIFAITNNLSLGGVKILSNVVFPVGRVIRITLDLSRSKKKVSLEGKVVWAKLQYEGQLYEMGIEFIHDYPKTFTQMFDHIYGQGFFSVEKKEQGIISAESDPSDEDRQSPL